MTVGLARAGFDLDLKEGESYENEFARLLGKETKIEIKRDFKCAATGNLFIEYRQKNRPSGIAVTEADYWAFGYAERRWLLIPTDELKQIARHIWRTFPERRVRGGDFNCYEGVLVPVASLVTRGASC
jgi:hypothetical protein